MEYRQKMLKLSPKIKMIISDFDGVFTDGSFYIDENLNQQKKLNFKDIMGVFLIIRQGIKFAVISGESTGMLDYFKQKFGIEEIYKGIRKKDEIMRKILKKHSLKKEEVLYMGDDINDIPAFKYAGFKIAPNNANIALKKDKSIQITEANGGNGAFREVADELMAVLNG